MNNSGNNKQIPWTVRNGAISRRIRDTRISKVVYKDMVNNKLNYHTAPVNVASTSLIVEVPVSNTQHVDKASRTRVTC